MELWGERMLQGGMRRKKKDDLNTDTSLEMSMNVAMTSHATSVEHFQSHQFARIHVSDVLW